MSFIQQYQSETGTRYMINVYYILSSITGITVTVYVTECLEWKGAVIIMEFDVNTFKYVVMHIYSLTFKPSVCDNVMWWYRGTV